MAAANQAPRDSVLWSETTTFSPSLSSQIPLLNEFLKEIYWNIYNWKSVLYVDIYTTFFSKLSDFDICYKKLTALQAQYPHNLIIFMYFI